MSLETRSSSIRAMMRDEFNIDKDRIYLTGHSMGGAGTYILGSMHADIWAAIAPVAPAAFMMTGNRAEILQELADANVPIMIIHGDEDEATCFGFARRVAGRLLGGRQGQYAHGWHSEP